MSNSRQIDKNHNQTPPSPHTPETPPEALPEAPPERLPPDWFMTPVGRFLATIGSVRLAIPLLILTALALAWGTWLESTQNADVARLMVYGAWWFALLMAMLCVCLIMAVVFRYPWRKKHLGFIFVHAGLVTLILGGFVSLYGRIEGTLTLQEGSQSAWIETNREHIALLEHDKGKFSVQASAPLELATRTLNLNKTIFKVVGRWPNSQQTSEIVDNGQQPLQAVRLSLDPRDTQGTWVGQTDTQNSKAILNGILLRVMPAGMTWHPQTPSTTQPTATSQPTASASQPAASTSQSASKSVMPCCGTKPYFKTGRRQITLPAPGEPIADGWRVKTIQQFKHALVSPKGLVEGDASRDNPAMVVVIEDNQGNVERHICFARYPDLVLTRQLAGNRKSGFQLTQPVPHEMPQTPTAPQATLVFQTTGANASGNEGLTVIYQRKNQKTVRRTFTGPPPYHMNAKGLTLVVYQHFSHARQARKWVPAPPAESNQPMVILETQIQDKTRKFYLPWKQPVPLNIAGKMAFLKYEPARHQLPFTLKLDDFRKKNYPGSQMAMAYESDVQMKTSPDAPWKSQRIWMNHPLVYKGWKVYQSGFIGQDISIFSVMKDPGLFWTYLGCIFLTGGILVMFYSTAFSQGHPGLNDTLETEENDSDDSNAKERETMQTTKTPNPASNNTGLSPNTPGNAPGNAPAAPENIPAPNNTHSDFTPGTPGSNTTRPLAKTGRLLLAACWLTLAFTGSKQAALAAPAPTATAPTPTSTAVTTAPAPMQSPASATTAASLSHPSKSWLDTLRYIAIQDRGRVMPLDSYAQEMAVQLTGRSYWSVKRGPKAFAGRDRMALLCDLIFRPDTLVDQPLILVQNRPFKKAVELDPKLRFFSARELVRNPEIRRLVRVFQQHKQKDPKAKPTKNQKIALALQEAISRISDFIQSRPLPIIPNAAGADQPFLNVSLEHADARTQAVQQAMLHFQSLYRTNPSDAKLAAAARAWVQAIHDTAVLPVSQRKRVRAEVFYNQHRPWRMTAIAFGLAIVLLGLAHLCLPKLFRILGALAITWGVAEQLLGLGLRIYILQRAPVSNTYESLLWMGLMAMLVGGIAQFINRKGWYLFSSLIAAELCVVFAMLVPLSDQTNALPPVLRSNYWLIIHVLVIVASYGILILSGILGHIYLIRNVLLARTPAEAQQTMGNPIIRQIYRSMQVGLFLLTAGTILGGVWAADSWGRFWGWDPKETWALISIIIYFTLLHARYVGWVEDLGLAVGSIAGVVCVVWTFYGVNYVMAAGLHSYGFGAGGEIWVGLWALAETLLVIACLIRRASLKHQHRPPTPKSSNPAATG